MAISPAHQLLMIIGGLLIGVGLLVAALLPGGGPTVVPPVGDVVIDRGGLIVTQWLEVGVGEDVNWSWGSDRSLLDFTIEVGGVGAIAHGDQYGDRGCLRGEIPFQFRIFIGHTNIAGKGEPSRVSINVVTGPSSGECPSLEDEALRWNAAPGRGAALLPMSSLAAGLAGAGTLCLGTAIWIHTREAKGGGKNLRQR